LRRPYARRRACGERQQQVRGRQNAPQSLSGRRNFAVPCCALRHRHVSFVLKSMGPTHAAVKIDSFL
jgi:hypothetical protein